MLTAQQLLNSLQEDHNKDVISVIGYIKLQEDEDKKTILFHFDKNDLGKWVSVPISLIDSVEIIGKTVQHGKIVSIANLLLKTPTSEEGVFLANIINLKKQEYEINQENEGLATSGINDGTLPLSKEGGFSFPGILFANPVKWLGSWQVGNG